MNKIRISDKTMVYEYQLEKNNRCVFYVTDIGLITIHIDGKNINIEDVAKYLREVTDIVVQKGLIPQINIVKSNHYLQELARKCKYKMVSAPKFRFNIWKYQS